MMPCPLALAAVALFAALPAHADAPTPGGPGAVAPPAVAPPLAELLSRRADGAYETRCGNKVDRTLFVLQMTMQHGVPERVAADGAGIFRVTRADGRQLLVTAAPDCSYRVSEAIAP